MWSPLLRDLACELEAPQRLLPLVYLRPTIHLPTIRKPFLSEHVIRLSVALKGGKPPPPGMSAAALMGLLSTIELDDTFAGANVLSLVVQVDKDLVTAGGPLLSVWASTHIAD